MNAENIKSRINGLCVQSEALIHQMAGGEVHEGIRAASLPVLDMISSGAGIFTILAELSDEGLLAARDFVNESESTLRAIQDFIKEKNNEQE